MKDFDFDELDRAVSSVLTKKQAENAVPVADSTQSDSVPVVQQPSDDSAQQPMPVADEASSVVPVETANDWQTPDPAPTDDAKMHDDSAQQPEVSDNDQLLIDAPEEEKLLSADNDTEEAGQPAHDAVEAEVPAVVADSAPEAKSDTIPQKRGRFMDMVHPSADMATAHLSLPSRSGVAVQPSANFSMQPEPSAPVAEADPAPEVDEVPVESPSESSSAISSEPMGYEFSGDETVSAATSHDATEPSEDTDQTPMAAAPAETSTPFMRDVPVTKRPLNAFGADAPHGDETSEVVVDDGSEQPHIEQATASLPKEFNQEIMAVEANETIGEQPAPEAQDQEADQQPQAPESQHAEAPAAVAAVNEQDAAQADSSDTHPVFDASVYQQPLQQPAPHSSKMMWVLIIAALFLIGAALGVLYFLYGQR